MELIRSRLRDDILQGHYSPGEPIQERAVAQQLAVSRMPLREALIQLERDGVVSIFPRRGARVCTLTPENMQSIYQAREELEGMAARLAAQRLNAQSLASFKEQYENVLSDSAALDQETTTALGNAFHDTVIHGSRNSVIIEMSGAIADRVQLCRRLSYGHASPPLALRAAHEHLGIADAIEQMDPDLAERRMREHIPSGRGSLEPKRLVIDHTRPFLRQRKESGDEPRRT